jgi:hypothetical protein
MLAGNDKQEMVLAMNARRDCSAGNSVDNECSQRIASGQ